MSSLPLANQELYTEEASTLSAENDILQREKKAMRDDPKASRPLRKEKLCQLTQQTYAS